MDRNSSARRLVRLLVAMAALTVTALGMSGTAGAISRLPPIDTDPVIRPVPNLTTAASVVPYGSSQWELRYTVTNRGNGPAPAFQVSVQENGGGPIKSTAHASLAAGASRSEVIHVPQTGCYFAARFTADSTRVVLESSESDNERVAIGSLSSFCPTQPKYQVKAVSFHANDETGIDWLGSDEVYWIFNGVGMTGTDLSSASHVFGDIDTGDTAYFGPYEGCLYLSCAGGPAPNGIGLSIAAWEKDRGYTNETLAEYANGFHQLGGILEPTDYMVVQWMGKVSTGIGDVLAYINSWAADDKIGSQTFAFSPVYLASRLPTVGSSFNDTRVYDDSGNYTMTVQVTRVG
jgi:CARDB protein